MTNDLSVRNVHCPGVVQSYLFKEPGCVIGWGFRWFVRCTGCTSTNLFAWLSERFMYIRLESLVRGSYIYHLDVIAGMQLCYKSS